MNWFSKGYNESLIRLQRKRRWDLFTSLFVWLLVPLLGVSCLIFTCRSHTQSMIQRLEALQVEKLRLESEREELSRSIASLSSRKRIYQYATEKLNMKYPSQDEIVLVMVDGHDQPREERQLVDDGTTVSYARQKGRDGNPINVLTHFFALYVF